MPVKQTYAHISAMNAKQTFKMENNNILFMKSLFSLT